MNYKVCKYSGKAEKEKVYSVPYNSYIKYRLAEVITN